MTFTVTIADACGVATLTNFLITAESQANALSCTMPKPKKRRRKANPVGRPTLLTPELQKRICSMIMAGGFELPSARACGISRHTFLEWMRRGEDHDERPNLNKYAKFANAIRLADATARVDAEIKVKASDPYKYLKHKHRDKPDEPGWSDTPTQLEVTGKEGAPLGLTLEMVRQFLDATDPEEEK
jgi:hypothetical protein